MSRPLRKSKLDGTPYVRRDEVEAEIRALSAISEPELERRAELWQASQPDYISPEVMLHRVRTATAGAHRDKLTEQLLRRVARLVRPVTDSGGNTDSLTRMNAREDVIDHFVDLLLSDLVQYDDSLDYYEVNFNAAVAADRHDANARHWKRENRTEALETEDGEISARVEIAIGDYDPFDAHELDKKDYRIRLYDAIASLPEFQRRIVVMWSQDIPIDSSDPSVMCMRKTLGRSEKSIRTHRDKAFASLKLRLERKGRL